MLQVVPKFRAKVDEYRNLIPVISALQNPSMKDRHWMKVEDVIGKQIPRDDMVPLQSLLEMKVHEWKDRISVISTEATQEQALEEMLANVQNKWATVEFVVLNYKESKDTFILGAVEDVMITLEDSMVTMSTILASRCFGRQPSCQQKNHDSNALRCTHGNSLTGLENTSFLFCKTDPWSTIVLRSSYERRLEFCTLSVLYVLEETASSVFETRINHTPLLSRNYLFHVMLLITSGSI